MPILNETYLRILVSGTAPYLPKLAFASHPSLRNLALLGVQGLGRQQAKQNIESGTWKRQAQFDLIPLIVVLAGAPGNMVFSYIFMFLISDVGVQRVCVCSEVHDCSVLADASLFSATFESKHLARRESTGRIKGSIELPLSLGFPSQPIACP